MKARMEMDYNKNKYESMSGLHINFLIFFFAKILFEHENTFTKDYHLLCIHLQHLCTLHEILLHWLFQDGTED